MSAERAIVVATEDGTEADVICPCGFEGHVSLYDIGDGLEFCCPTCDICWPSNPVIGPDGLTEAQRRMRAQMDEIAKRRESGEWPSSTSST